MTIKDEISPRIKADARLLGDGTLWIKTDKIDDIGRVIVEDGKTGCKQFYQDAQPETAHWVIDGLRINCSACGHSTWSRPKFERTVRTFNFCPNCGAKMKPKGKE